MPLYLAAKERILSMITQGEYAPGKKLPSEAELGRALGVSRVTLREALKVLEREGMLISRHGKGTFVSADWSFFNRTLNQLKSIGEMVRAADLKYENRLLGCETRIADEYLCRTLQLPAGTAVLDLERIRVNKGLTITHSIDTFPRDLMRKEEFDPEIFGEPDFSLFVYLERECGVRISHGWTQVVPVASGQGIVPNVDLGEGPCFLLEQTYSDVDNRPVLYCRDYLRSNCFRIYVMRKRTP